MLGLYVGPLGQRTYLTDITRLIWPLRNVRVSDLPKPVKFVAFFVFPAIQTFDLAI